MISYDKGTANHLSGTGVGAGVGISVGAGSVVACTSEVPSAAGVAVGAAVTRGL